MVTIPKLSHEVYNRRLESMADAVIIGACALAFAIDDDHIGNFAAFVNEADSEQSITAGMLRQEAAKAALVLMSLSDAAQRRLDMVISTEFTS